MTQHGDSNIKLPLVKLIEDRGWIGNYYAVILANEILDTYRLEPVVPVSDPKVPTRPGWDEYFLNICKTVSQRADCRRAQHGCVIVQNNRIVSTGYNGAPSGGPSCLKGECPRGLLTNEQCASLSADYTNCVALHAEQNAIAYANRVDCVDATLFVTGKQCDMCEKLTRAAGIRRVVWPGGEKWL